MLAIDALNGANWQRAGKKAGRRPKPVYEQLAKARAQQQRASRPQPSLQDKIEYLLQFDPAFQDEEPPKLWVPGDD